MANYKKYKLPNGLRVLLVPMKNTETITLLAMVAAGSKYEPDNIAGVSHFLEHAFFKGTKKRPNTKAVSEYLDSIGGEYNAFTSKEYTGFYAKTAAKHLDHAFDFVSDILQNATFPKEEIERERFVILEEMKMYFDTPMIHVGELFEKLLYNGQPAGRLIVGTRESILATNREKIVAYLQKHYRAKNMTLCLAGNFTDTAAQKMVKKYFGNLEKGDGGTKLKVIEKQRTPQIFVENKKTDQTHLCLGVRAYHHLHPKRFALKLLSLILGGTMSSRLFINIRDKRGLAYYIRASVEAFTDSGYLVIQAGIDNQKSEEVTRLILAELRAILKNGVTTSELKKAKECYKGRTLLGLESSDELVMYYGIQELLKKQILEPKEVFKRIDAVTAKNILSVGQEIFTNGKLNLAIIGPDAKKEKLFKILSF